MNLTLGHCFLTQSTRRSDLPPFLKLHHQFHYWTRRAMSSFPARPDTVSPGSTLQGNSGRVYKIEQILSQRREPLLCVYRASAEGKTFILKDIVRGDFEYQTSLQQHLSSSPYLRVFVDTIPDRAMFVYDFLASDLLKFARHRLPTEARKSILRDVLMGLGELHDRRIIHTDIKPSNILIDYGETPNKEVAVTQVRISDLEDSVLLDPDKSLKGCLCGNEFWRSPESWARAKQNLPSDVYSFGIMAIYIMDGEMVFAVSDEELNGDMAWWHVLRRHISYFADEEGFQGLLEHIGQENPFFERLISLAGDFGPGNPMEPFARWHYVDADFRDLIQKMTNLDPNRRISARKALEHPWFRDTKL
ncbi:kinase-like domain-containing protein [Chaetomium sp. MPI-CAGE-AT-0009]|nr:kinase-like domain-containing protein [Chaetomium sp. MPI-CAGE-AT-0009]